LVLGGRGKERKNIDAWGSKKEVGAKELLLMLENTP
jgi:hypothetical protein